MNLIVAVTSDWGIGKDGGLLISLPEDMKHFRETTKNAVLLMGRSTLESFPSGKPLKGRVNIVMTRQRDFQCEGAVIVHSFEEAVRETEKYDDDSVFVIGGAEIYKQFLPYCRFAYVTKIDAGLEADRYMPDLDSDSDWKVIDESETDNCLGIDYRFILYENNNVKRALLC